MALQLSPDVKNKPITNPNTANSVHIAHFKHTFTNAAASADVIEVGALPAGCQIVGAKAFSNATGATFDVGFVSGVYGDKSDTRTLGVELFDGAARNAVQELEVFDAMAIDRSDEARGIGISVSANEAAGAAYVEVAIYYVA